MEAQCGVGCEEEHNEVLQLSTRKTHSSCVRFLLAERSEPRPDRIAAFETGQKGHAIGTLRGVRTTVSTVLQSAVDRGYLDGNAAHGIRMRTTGVKPETRFYTPAQV